MNIDLAASYNKLDADYWTIFIPIIGLAVVVVFGDWLLWGYGWGVSYVLFMAGIGGMHALINSRILNTPVGSMWIRSSILVTFTGC